MLKKNLVRTGLSSPLLLLFFPFVTATKGELKYQGRKHLQTNRLSTDTSYQPLNVDSSGLLSSTGTYDANAPKILMNKHVTKFVKSFLASEDEALQKAQKRSTSYFKMMDEIFSRYHLPLELKYLAVVESDLKSDAVSKVGAKGMWQFMPETAKDLGLKITSKHDERTYPYKSTIAAAKYLKDLYAQFNDWLLTIAAYNSGPGPVLNAIKKSGSRNFWALQYYLPEESRGHVKRFIGTHYYFEGKGSMVTMTKAETKNYLNELVLFNASIQPKVKQTDSAVVATTFVSF